MTTTPDIPLASIPVHDGIEEWMAVALTDGLSAQERRPFDDHLASCARCRELYAEEIAMNQTMQTAFDSIRPLPGFERRLTEAFRRRRGAAFGEWLRVFVGNLARRPAARVLGATAIVLALMALGVGLTGEQTSPGSSELSSHQVSTLDTSIAGAGKSPVSAEKKAERQAQITAPASRPFYGSTAGSSPLARAAPAASRRLTVDRVDAKAQGFNTFGLQPESESRAADAASSATSPIDGHEAESSSLASNAVGEIRSAAVPAAAPPPADAPGSAAVPTPGPDSRKLIRNATVELQVTSFDTALDALGAGATQTGRGYVATVDSSRLPNGKRTGTIVIKVLPEHLDAFLARLKELGEVKNQNVSTQDVTKDYFDTDARLRNARRMEDRLLKILDEDKGKLTEILQVEKELGRVREDIEKMQGELQLYDSLVRYATVTITLYEKDLEQPAAFLLRQTADLTLLCADVEKTYGEARHAAEDAHAQIENSQLSRAETGRATAYMRLLLAPDTADDVIARIKALARVGSFKMTGESVAQNGDESNTAPGAGAEKVERRPVNLDITISHDDDAHRRVSLTLIAPDLDAAFDKTRAAALAASGEITDSSYDQSAGGHGSAMLVLLLPAKSEAAVLTTVRGLGRTRDFNVQRDSSPAGDDAASGPVSVTVNFADEEPAVQQTSMAVLCSQVDKAQEEVRKIAADSGAQLRSSSFDQGADGGEQDSLVFRMPLRTYNGFVSRVKPLGKVKDVSLHRQDPVAANGSAANADDTAPVEVSLRLYSQGRVIDDQSGFAATLRRTLGQGAVALMWSLRMIGVAVAFLAPWAIAGWIILWVTRLIKKR